MIVFTDLDGTLLDHETYDYRPALPAISALKNAGVPIVLATSKTGAEVDPLLGELDLPGPAIVENGAGLHRRGDEVRSRSRYEELRSAVDAVRSELGFRFEGFGDLGSERVARLTGLASDAARLACTRRFSEPGLFDGDDEAQARFVEALGGKGIVAQQGGRFLTLSFGGTKAEPMDGVIEELEASGPIVALGDAPNDRAMLERADFAVLVRNPSRGAPEIKPKPAATLIRTTKPGPSGWCEAVLGILHDRNGSGDTSSDAEIVHIRGEAGA